MHSRHFLSYLKKFWNFIWYDEGILSWIVNLLLAFVLVKFIIYPGLGLLLGTSYPVVAVVSGSMEHGGFAFDDWWRLNEAYYKNLNISKTEFSTYFLLNGFNKGDLMVLKGAKNVSRGDILVFRGDRNQPIIHRVVVARRENGTLFIQTKGDNNLGSRFDEIGIPEENFIGKAAFRVPYLGWFKLILVESFSFLTGN